MEQQAPKPVVIEQPAYLIFAVPDAPDGRLSPHDRDLLGAARQLADHDGGAVAVLLFGALKDDLGAAGADRVLHFDCTQFAGYAPERRALAVIEACQRYAPRQLLFADSPLGGADLGRRVAVKLGERAAGNVWKLDAANQRLLRRADGSRRDIVQPLGRVILLAAEAADPVVNARYEARPLELPESGETAAITVTAAINDRGLLPVDPNAVALSEAEFIVSGGNGVRDWEAFHRLAAALGATEGGSRVAVDDGFLPRERQIGATGAYVSARVYLALGISGAPQHLQGISDCERVIAVNFDHHCDMVKRADLALIGDVQAIMPELARLAALHAERSDG